MLAGCEHADIAGPSAGLDASVLTGVAAQSLDATGHFILPLHGADSTGEISVDRARRIATAYLSTLSSVKDMLDGDRGAPIHWGLLTPCPRAYYVESAYSDVPTDAPMVIQKQARSQWLVGFCYGTTEEMVVAISAYATDVTLSDDGSRITAPGVGNFLPMGVPVGAEVPMSPEATAIATAAASRRRVAEVPQLVMRSIPAAPVIAVWRVGLESDVTVSGELTHVARPRRTVFAGPLNGWRSPAFADAIPPADAGPILEPVQYFDRVVTLMRKSEAPSRLELITFMVP
jgi:hypothetical protein